MCDENITVMRFRELVDKEKSRESIAKKMTEQGLNCNTSTITKHYNGDRTISTEYVIKYAKHFGVSADYLLGLSDVATTNIEIKAICEYTGLSELSLKVLNMYNQIKQLESDIYKNGCIDVINFLLEKSYINNDLFNTLHNLTNHSFSNEILELEIEDKLIDLCSKSNEDVYKMIYDNGTIIVGSAYRNHIVDYAEHLCSNLIHDLYITVNKQSYDYDICLYPPKANANLEDDLESAKHCKKFREENKKKEKCQKEGD